MMIDEEIYSTRNSHSVETPRRSLTGSFLSDDFLFPMNMSDKQEMEPDGILFPMKNIRKPRQNLGMVTPNNTSKEQISSKNAIEPWCKECKCYLETSESGESGSVRSHALSAHFESMTAYMREQKGENGPFSRKDSENLEIVDRPLRRKLNFLIVKYICSAALSFSQSENKDMENIINYLLPGDKYFEMPSRHTCARGVSDLVGRTKAALRSQIREEMEFYSMTTDIWSGSNQDSYLGCTLHYITKDFVARNIILSVKPVTGRHVAENLVKWIMEVLDEWNLPLSRMVMLVRDGGSNIVKASRLLEVDDIHCIAHCLHLVVHPFTHAKIRDSCGEDHITPSSAHTSAGTMNDLNGTDELADEIEVNFETNIDEDVADYNDVEEDEEEDAYQVENIPADVQISIITRKLRKTAAFIRQSTQAKEKLLNSTTGRASPSLPSTFDPLFTVPIDVPTRWNSEYYMLQRFHQQKHVIDSFINYLATAEAKSIFNSKILDPITCREWAMIEGILILLGPFEVLTRVLSSEKNPTMTVALLLLRSLKRKLQNTNMFCTDIRAWNDDIQFTHSVKQSMKMFYMNHQNFSYFPEILQTLSDAREKLLRRFTKRFTGLSGSFLWTTALHPDQLDLKIFTDHENERIKAALQAELENCIQNSVTETHVVSSVGGGSRIASTSISSDIDQAWNEAREKRTKSGQHTPGATLRHRAENEVKRYFEMEHHINGNLLQWWKNNRSVFPDLARVARKWLSVPASSTPSERLFSCCGFVQNAKRNRLSSARLEAQMMIKRNEGQLVEKLQSLNIPDDEIEAPESPTDSSSLFSFE